MDIETLYLDISELYLNPPLKRTSHDFVKKILKKYSAMNNYNTEVLDFHEMWPKLMTLFTFVKQLFITFPFL